MQYLFEIFDRCRKWLIYQTKRYYSILFQVPFEVEISLIQPNNAEIENPNWFIEHFQLSSSVRVQLPSHLVEKRRSKFSSLASILSISNGRHSKLSAHTHKKQWTISRGYRSHFCAHRIFNFSRSLFYLLFGWVSRWCVLGCFFCNGKFLPNTFFCRWQHNHIFMDGFVWILLFILICSLICLFILMPLCADSKSIEMISTINGSEHIQYII